MKKCTKTTLKLPSFSFYFEANLLGLTICALDIYKEEIELLSNEGSLKR
jgi:hypothetical protein